MTTVEEIHKDKVVGSVVNYDGMREIWDIDFDHKDNIVELTTEAIAEMDIFIGGDMDLVFKYKKEMICSACKTSTVFFDEQEDEWYCPRCME